MIEQTEKARKLQNLMYDNMTETSLDQDKLERMRTATDLITTAVDESGLGLINGTFPLQVVLASYIVALGGTPSAAMEVASNLSSNLEKVTDALLEFRVVRETAE